MKRALLALALAAFVSCQKHEAPSSTTTTTEPAAKPFRVGLLTPGSVNDGGWNAIAYEGLQRIHNELGAEVSHQ